MNKEQRIAELREKIYIRSMGIYLSQEELFSSQAWLNRLKTMSVK
jgi:hypothetical protein